MGRAFRYLTIVVLLLFVGNEASAQWMKERGWVRKGNRQFERKEFDKSLEIYAKALYYKPDSFEAQYDLASALYKTEKYDKAEELLISMLSDTTRTELERGELAYNLGNTQFAQQKYQEALMSYRYAMRCNPSDEDAKYNYALTKRMLQQQQQQQQEQEQKQDQDQKQKPEDKKDKDQKGKQDQDKDKQGEDKQNEDKQGDKDKPQPQDGGEKEQPAGQHPKSNMSEAEREAILQAMQAEEDKTQNKLKEGTAIGVRGGNRKKW